MSKPIRVVISTVRKIKVDGAVFYRSMYELCTPRVPFTNDRVIAVDPLRGVEMDAVVAQVNASLRFLYLELNTKSVRLIEGT